MHRIKLFSMLFAALIASPAIASDSKNIVSTDGAASAPVTEASEDRSSADAVQRPQRPAVKMSPTVRTSPPRPDDSGKMRRVAPQRSEAPLQNVPALKNLYPSSAQDKNSAPDASSSQKGETPAR